MHTSIKSKNKKHATGTSQKKLQTEQQQNFNLLNLHGLNKTRTSDY
jgi:hypothetical protein